MGGWRFSRLGLLFGLLFWPFEALLHTLFFSGGTFLDNLLVRDADEVWMRLLISTAFIAFGLFAEREMRAQQEMRRQLEQKRRRLQQIIDHTYDAYVGIDHAGRIIGWNKSAERLFGWPLQQALGRSVSCMIPEHLRAAHERGLARYHKERVGGWLYQPVKTEALHRDGRVFPVEMVVTPILNDGEEEFFAFIRKQTSQSEEV